MLLVVYDPEKGHVVPDNTALTFAQDVIKSYQIQGGNKKYTTGTAIVLLAFRVLVKRGAINHEDIQFRFGDQYVTLNPNGGTSHAISEMRDRLLTALIGGREYTQ